MKSFNIDNNMKCVNGCTNCPCGYSLNLTTNTCYYVGVCNTSAINATNNTNNINFVNNFTNNTLNNTIFNFTNISNIDLTNNSDFTNNSNVSYYNVN